MGLCLGPGQPGHFPEGFLSGGGVIWWRRVTCGWGPWPVSRLPGKPTCKQQEVRATGSEGTAQTRCTRKWSQGLPSCPRQPYPPPGQMSLDCPLFNFIFRQVCFSVICHSKDLPNLITHISISSPVEGGERKYSRCTSRNGTKTNKQTNKSIYLGHRAFPLVNLPKAAGSIHWKNILEYIQWVYAYTYMCVCVFVCIYEFIYACNCVSICMCTCICNFNGYILLE